MSEFESEKVESPFEFFDFGYEDVVEATKHLDSKHLGRDNRVCICGHPVNRHKPNARGVIQCKPTAMYCACRDSVAVLEAEDLRDFLRKTVGGAELHALSRGIQSAVQKGHSVTWLVESRCGRCKELKKIAPVPVSANGVILNEESSINVFLCRECRAQA